MAMPRRSMVGRAFHRVDGRSARGHGARRRAQQPTHHDLPAASSARRAASQSAHADPTRDHLPRHRRRWRETLQSIGRPCAAAGFTRHPA